MVFTNVLQAVSALGTPIIAAIVAYIAWRQLKTDTDKLRCALWDRRFGVYSAFTDLCAAARAKGISQEDMSRFSMHFDEAAFLFDVEVEQFVKRTWSNGWELQVVKNEISAGIHDPDERKIKTRRECELLLWFGKEAEEESKRLFRKYLDYRELSRT
jgi:hypothetical protein